MQPHENPSRLRRAISILVAITVTLSCATSPTDPPIEVGEGRPMLFIGNSHSYTSDVTGILQALADSVGEKLAPVVVANANLALIDHWNIGAAERIIRSRAWDLVVMQQGWTPAGVCQDTLRLAARNFAPAIRASGATPALFQVWAPSNNPGQWQGTIESYRIAAKDVNGTLFPVAEVWRDLLADDPSLDLYLDGLHANPTGAYVAALVMYARIFNRTPVGLPATLQTRSGFTIAVPGAVALKMQETVARIALSPTPDEPPVAQPLITSRC